MAYGTPTDPVAGTVITVAYAVANVLNPIRWLRLLTGNADPPGSAYVVVSTSTSGTSWQKVPTDAIADLAITNNKMAGASVGTANLIDLAVTSPKLADTSVTTSKLVNASVTNDKMAANSIGAANIIDGEVGTGELADLSVTNAKIAAATIDLGSKGVDGSLTNAKIAAATIDLGAKTVDGTLTNAKITSSTIDLGSKSVDASLTNAKIASSTIDLSAKAVNGSLTTAKIADLAVTNAKIAAATIDLGSKAADGSLTTAKIADGAVTNVKIATATATPTANAIPIADGSGKLDGWITALSPGAYVPSGVIAAFETASAIASGWVRYTAADGRMLVGAGTTFSTTFTEATNYGSAWSFTPVGSVTIVIASHAATRRNANIAFGAGTDNVEDDHGHGITSQTFTGSSTTWVIPSRAVVWAQKS